MSAEQERVPVGQKFFAWVESNHAKKPALSAQIGATWRGGREDLWNALIPALPDSMQVSREMGAPGSPTPQITTENLTGRPVDKELDR